jgi:hypothetical protein
VPDREASTLSNLSALGGLGLFDRPSISSKRSGPARVCGGLLSSRQFGDKSREVPNLGAMLLIN